MTCKGICIRHEAVRPPDGYRYSNGQKCCRVCGLFMNWDGVNCPCCGMTLSTNQHRSKYKRRYRLENQGGHTWTYGVSAHDNATLL